MKFKKYILASFLTASLFMSCTENFEKTNTDPYNSTSSTPQGIMAGVQYFEFAEPRFLTWRGNIIYSSQFSHQFSYNYKGAWFGADSYQNNTGYTNGMFNTSYQKISLNARNLLKTYTDLKDTNGIAVANIMMSWFYQKMTDIFGDIPYSELIGSTLILKKPKSKYDSQQNIYKNIMENLKTQMNAIGSSTKTITGFEGDYVYQGNPQKWKVFANTLRLRMAIRSRDAFIKAGNQAEIDKIIKDCLANPLIDKSNQALLKRSSSPLIQSNLDGGFEDVYYGFGGVGSKFTFADRYVSMLLKNNDPRLKIIVLPSEKEGKFIGSKIGSKSQTARDYLSSPSSLIIGKSVTDVADVVPIKILSASESYSLQAEAALLGYGGSANTLYQKGISASMNYWQVSTSKSSDFINNESVATLSGSNDEQLKMIWNQRWLNALMNGYESWALVRRTDLIPKLTDTNDENFWITQPNSGVVPKRLPYSATEELGNKVNVDEAVKRQGGNDIMKMNNPVWWDIK